MISFFWEKTLKVTKRHNAWQWTRKSTITCNAGLGIHAHWTTNIDNCVTLSFSHLSHREWKAYSICLCCSRISSTERLFCPPDTGSSICTCVNEKNLNVHVYTPRIQTPLYMYKVWADSVQYMCHVQHLLIVSFKRYGIYILLNSTKLVPTCLAGSLWPGLDMSWRCCFCCCRGNFSGWMTLAGSTFSMPGEPCSEREYSESVGATQMKKKTS